MSPRSRKLLAALAAFLIFAVGFAAGGSSTAARPTPTQAPLIETKEL